MLGGGAGPPINPSSSWGNKNPKQQNRENEKNTNKNKPTRNYRTKHKQGRKTYTQRKTTQNTHPNKQLKQKANSAHKSKTKNKRTPPHPEPNGSVCCSLRRQTDPPATPAGLGHAAGDGSAPTPSWSWGRRRSQRHSGFARILLGLILAVRGTGGP